MSTPITPAAGYVVVGAGAIGGTIAHALARAGREVRVIDADADHVAAIRADGLTIRRGDGDQSVPVRALTVAEAAPPGDPLRRVILAVKEAATADAARWIAPRLAPDGYVVSMQNGLNEPTIAAEVGWGRTVGAFVDLFADVIEPGVIADGGRGAIVIGELDGADSTRVGELVSDLAACGTARTTDNILGFLWAKLGFSSMLAATAVVDDAMAELIARHPMTMTALAGEVYAVADRHRIRLESFDGYRPEAFRRDADPTVRDRGIAALISWLRGQRKTRSGVWRDLAVRHRPTESVPRFRAVITDAEQHGIDTPYLRALVTTLHQLETEAIPMAPNNLDRLAAIAESTAR